MSRDDNAGRQPRSGVPEGAPTELAHTQAVGDLDRADDAWVDRVIDGRYRVESKLGEGGMGAVYVARHLKLQKQVALKVVRAELAGDGELAVRFAREAMATAQFEHPHVASATDYGSLPEGGAYLVMQLVRGQSLRDRLADGPMPWRDACRLLAQVADALSAARASGIVHRDLKPENVLVERREDGSELAKVLDFGIAHVSPRTAAAADGAMPHRTLTRIGTVMGTPGYMAPEQAVGDRVDHRADLYALGVVLWECVTGRELWEGPDIRTIITRQVSEQPPPLSEAAPQAVPKELDSLVQQLLAHHPDARPAHAGEIRDSLRQLAELPAESAPGSRAARQARVFGEHVVAYARTTPARASRLVSIWKQQPPRLRAVQTAAAVAGLSLLFGLSSLMVGDQKPAAESPPAESAPAKVAAGGAMLQRVANRVEAVFTPGIPGGIASEVKAVLEGGRRAERRDAAVVVLAFEPRNAVAPHVIALAELEAARGCRTRKRAIKALLALGDPQVVPALERWRRLPKRGCGFLDLQDCYGCIRRPLRDAIRALSAAD